MSDSNCFFSFLMLFHMSFFLVSHNVLGVRNWGKLNPCLLHLLHWQVDSSPRHHVMWWWVGGQFCSPMIVLCYAKPLQSCLTLCNPMDCQVVCQAPLPMEISRQEYWSGLPCSPPRDLPNSGMEPESPALAGGFFTTRATWEAFIYRQKSLNWLIGILSVDWI